MPGGGGYWLRPPRSAATAASSISGGPSVSGKPWPRLIEPVRTAKADISAKIVVPNARMRVTSGSVVMSMSVQREVGAGGGGEGIGAGGGLPDLLAVDQRTAGDFAVGGVGVHRDDRDEGRGLHLGAEGPGQLHVLELGRPVAQLGDVQDHGRAVAGDLV